MDKKIIEHIRKLNMKAFAKINIFLDLNYKKNDGYHDISSVMQSISLYDDISLEIAARDINITCDVDNIPLDRKNTCYRAAEEIINRFKLNSGIKIDISKKIPSEAGLGGGSSDAAAVIQGMNILFDLKMDIDDMIEIGKTIGADIPFCLVGGTCLCEGIGEKITRLTEFNWQDLILIKPDLSISTPALYGKCTDKDYKLNNLDAFLKHIEYSDDITIVENISNTLETVALRDYDIIDEIKQDLKMSGCINSMMTGSGSVVVGFIKKGEKEKVMANLSKKYHEVYFTKTLSFDENRFFR